jgi:hypothetical protein
LTKSEADPSEAIDNMMKVKGIPTKRYKDAITFALSAETTATLSLSEKSQWERALHMYYQQAQLKRDVKEAMGTPLDWSKGNHAFDMTKVTCAKRFMLEPFTK